MNFAAVLWKIEALKKESEKDKCTHLKDNKKYGFETCKEI